MTDPTRIAVHPPILHPNDINAMYMDMFNKGQLYVPILGSHPISIDEWRQRELAKLVEGAAHG